MDELHGFSFLLGVAITWLITKQLRKDEKASEDEWLVRVASAPTDAEIEHALDRLKVELRLRKLNEFSPINLLEKDGAGSQYLRYMRIKMYRDTLRSNGWQQAARVRSGGE